MSFGLKKIVPCIVACIFVAGCGIASGPTEQSVVPVSQRAPSAESYYQQLISSSPQPVAALTLFLSRMPKGGDLHHHYSGSLYAETYLDWMGRAGYCVYRADNPATDGRKFKIEIDPEKLKSLARVQAAPPLKPAAGKICLSAREVLEDDGFYRELLSVWSNKDFHNHFHLQPPSDKQFFDTFGFFGDVSDYSFLEGLTVLKNYAKQENVQYLETMLKSSPALSCPEAMTKRLNALKGESIDSEIEQALGECIAYLEQDPNSRQQISGYVQMLESLAAKIGDDEFALRFQAYVRRNADAGKVFPRLYASFAADNASAMIVGTNFVGPENEHVALRDYSLHMKMFRFLQARYPESKLSLHSGELAMGMVPPDALRFHIDEAVRIAGARRIGHGIDIAYESNANGLLNLMRERNIAVEINLVSNEFILGVANELHPLSLYQQHGVPYVISTDDAGVSRSTLGNEYLLFVTRYKPSYSELKKTVYSSIRHSFLAEAEKQSQLDLLDRKFAEFEQGYAQ